MDRRYICQACGTKWFIHEERGGEPDLTSCGRCDGPLVRLLESPAAGFARPESDEDTSTA